MHESREAKPNRHKTQAQVVTHVSCVRRPETDRFSILRSGRYPQTSSLSPLLYESIRLTIRSRFRSTIHAHANITSAPSCWVEWSLFRLLYVPPRTVRCTKILRPRSASFRCFTASRLAFSFISKTLVPKRNLKRSAWPSVPFRLLFRPHARTRMHIS